MLLVLNLPLAGLWAKLFLIPRPYLYAGILMFASLGAYAANGSPFDLWLLLVLGALGFAMRRYGLPVVPLIVGFVPTKEGRAALDTAMDEAVKRGSRLVVVNTSTGAASADNRYVDDDQLAALTVELDGSGLDDEITHNVQRKDRSDVLVDIAEETNAELIVIGLRRRTPVGKLILGSQAQRVLLDANCPVLAVKAPR